MQSFSAHANEKKRAKTSPQWQPSLVSLAVKAHIITEIKFTRKHAT